MSTPLDKSLFNLKYSAKQLQISSKKSAKEEALELNKVKRAIEKGDPETARIYAENAIRKKNEYLSYLRLAARIEAVASRVQTANSMSKVTGSMNRVISDMERSMSTMNVQEISKCMDKFERQFEDLDVNSQYMETSVNAVTATTAPADEVSSLLRQVADMHHLELKEGMNATPNSNPLFPEQQISLDERLAKLRNMN